MPRGKREQMSGYLERPWTAQYREGLGDELDLPAVDGLTAFSATVARDPEGIFLRYFDATLTFAEVDGLSSALAAAFVERYGVGVGDRVAVQLQNIPAFAVALLGAWKAGAVFVPVNPMLREGELVSQLEDCGAEVLVTLESLFEPIGRIAVERVDSVAHVVTASELDFLEHAPELLASSTRARHDGCDDLMELLEAHRGDRGEPVRPPDPDDVAVLTYTSGTTGASKGAMNSHANLTADTTLMEAWLALDDQDVMLAGAPLFHITGLVLQLALSMNAGVPLVLTYRFTPEVGAAAIEAERITYAVMPITAYIGMLNSDEARGRSLTSLTKALSGGAPVPAQTVEDFEAHFGVHIHNAYGLTESSSACICGPLGVRSPVDAASGALSVGVPLPEVDARIVDDHGQDVPVGEVGELIIRGPQVVSGYWNKPEETRHAVRDGWFHTGDVFTMDADGWFYIIDRKKDMIISSGYKVWPRDVEDALYTHPAVLEAAVIGAPDDYRGETVKAVLSLKPGATVTEEELVAHCRQRLSAYKIPRIVEFRDELPKTATGKILRRQLRPS